MANNGQLIVQNDIFYPNTSSSNVIDLDEVMSNKYLKEVAFTTRQKSTGYKVNDKVNFKNGPLDIYLLCVKDGTTTDADLLTLPDDINIDESFYDGTVEWTVKRFADYDTPKNRVDTSSSWQNKNPILEKGELGIESDTNYIKVGDGETTWNSLPYVSSPSADDKLGKDDIAKQAISDALGNDISKTYIKELSADGTTITYTKGDGTSNTIEVQDTTYKEATVSSSGLMSAEDKQKLDKIQVSAEVNQNAFSSIKVGASTISADNKTDTFELVAGNNISLTPNTTSDKITISLSGIISNATNADKATQDSRGQNIADTYIKNITGNNTNKLTITKGNNVESSLIINNVANANVATKANQDSTGQIINSTYIKSITYDGSNLVITKGNGATNKIEVTNISKIYPVGSIYMSVTSTNPATLFGIGTWQALPAGRVLLAQGRSDWGTTYNINDTGGEVNHTLTQNEMPVHGHSGSANTSGSTHTHTLSLNQRHGKDGAWQSTPFFSNGDTGSSGQRVTATLSAAGSHTHGISINNAGGGQPHNNMQPYLVVYMWKRTA